MLFPFWKLYYILWDRKWEGKRIWWCFHANPCGHPFGWSLISVIACLDYDDQQKLSSYKIILLPVWNFQNMCSFESPVVNFNKSLCLIKFSQNIEKRWSACQSSVRSGLRLFQIGVILIWWIFNNILYSL